MRSALPGRKIADIVAPAAAEAALLANHRASRAAFMRSAFERLGIAVVLPTDAQIARMTRHFEEEIEHGVKRPETLAWFEALGARLLREEEIDGFMLANTDLPAWLEGTTLDPVSLDPVRLHVEDIARRQALIARPSFPSQGECIHDINELSPSPSSASSAASIRRRAPPTTSA